MQICEENRTSINQYIGKVRKVQVIFYFKIFLLYYNKEKKLGNPSFFFAV